MTVIPAKHRVTNFGAHNLEVILADGSRVTIPPGVPLVAVIGQIIHGPGRNHYSVRPAERQAGYAMFLEDEDDG